MALKSSKSRNERANNHVAHSRYIHRTEHVRKQVENDRTGTDIDTLKRAIADNLYYQQGVDEFFATPHDYYMALAYTIRDRLVHRWIHTEQEIYAHDVKTVYYLSAEFLMGRQLQNNLINVGLWEPTYQALKESGLDLYDLLEQEHEPGLGNGGLGRLAACFLDSLSTLEIPAVGYGIRYEFGIFEQLIIDGWQAERPDRWLKLGTPWEIARPEHSYKVKFWGKTEAYTDEHGKVRKRWNPDLTVLGTAYDTLVPGYATNNVNMLRLWAAGASKEFDFQVFDAGDYERAVSEKTFSETISKVLYPNDSTPQGRVLRLQQQYFFVSCSLQDILRRYRINHNEFDLLPEKIAVQMNDTHPAIAVAEMMRLLIDEYDMAWDKAWDLTSRSMGYTNHTLLSEALEKWPVSLLGGLLPRHLELIYEINSRFLDEVKLRYPNDEGKIARLSLIEEGEEKKIRMAHLACVGSHAVNGVAALHTKLLQQEVLRDFYDFWPTKFSNKTNGITPRRFLLMSNPKLALLITQKVGKGWIKNLDDLKRLESYADDPNFQRAWRQIKMENKDDLAEYILQHNKIEVDVASLFDIQVKRLHEYKRQLLDLLYIVTLYNRLKSNPNLKIQPRTFIFGAKAAPGYMMAKLIIKLINAVAQVVNNDPDVRNQIKVVFLANFCVSLGERVYPAADLSEQISTAGKEASGTGNMKFALNGAVTIGTFDGANIEIREAVGEDNFFLFGLKVEEVNELKQRGYNPSDYYHSLPELKAAIDRIASGCFAGGDAGLFEPIVRGLLTRDEYLLCADYKSYVECQDHVSEVYADKQSWTRMSILNTLRVGRFSSDRTIREYCEEIWNVKPLKVDIKEYNPNEAYLRPKKL